MIEISQSNKISQEYILKKLDNAILLNQLDDIIEIINSDPS